MKTQKWHLDYPMIALACVLFLVALVCLIPLQKTRPDPATEMNKQIVEAARNGAEAAMPLYKDWYWRRCFSDLTGAVHYRLERQQTHNAVV
ncbi:MAG: hypothetical protein ACRYFS_01090, partial [Janthinobacterium lividum]